MRTSDFDYYLPSELIAYYPLPDRENCNLEIVSRSDNKISHDKFFNLTSYLTSGDVLVLNNTKVIPARIYARSEKRDNNVEILLLEKIDSKRWHCLMKKPRDNEQFIIDKNISAEISRENNGEIIISFNRAIDIYLERIGYPPLPPYIERKPEESDRKNYQTVYAIHEGSVAAPTAGLHFTKNLIKRIEDMGVSVEYLTLHVGYGTFKPVKTEDLKKHRMHSEYFEIKETTCETVNKAKLNGNRIVAVGTTSLRTLESCLNEEGQLISANGKTELFIYPGYDFKIVDTLITNFHMPRSTLFMLVCALAGRELTLTAYEEAKNRGYRFLSYGDAMIII